MDDLSLSFLTMLGICTVFLVAGFGAKKLINSVIEHVFADRLKRIDSEHHAAE